MRDLSARLSAELPRQITRFRETFPRFQCDTAVYFLYAAGAFDGATREVTGKDALMFGLDTIARLKEPLSPLFAHELFHVYHAERIPKPPEAFYWQMWEEGLASYVSRRLNPDVPESQVCCVPPAEPIDAVPSGRRSSPARSSGSTARRRTTTGATSSAARRRSTFRAAPATCSAIGSRRRRGRRTAWRSSPSCRRSEVRKLVESELKRMERETH